MNGVAYKVELRECLSIFLVSFSLNSEIILLLYILELFPSILNCLIFLAILFSCVHNMLKCCFLFNKMLKGWIFTLVMTCLEFSLGKKMQSWRKITHSFCWILMVFNKQLTVYNVESWVYYLFD